MNDIDERLINEVTDALRSNDMNTRRFTAGGSMAATYATRKALETVIKETPWHAVTWITYAMSYIAWQDALNTNDKNALKADLDTANKRIEHLEKENHNTRDDWSAAEEELNTALSGLEAVDAALEALKHQIAVRVQDRAIAAALQAQIDLIQDMTGGVK